MSLRDRLLKADKAASSGSKELFARYGVLGNPYPAASQTSNNPHLATSLDKTIESAIETFVRDHKSEVVIIQGAQGTGKTNFLNFYESEIAEVAGDLTGVYVVRYLADPEASFEGTVRRLFQELGKGHFTKLAVALRKKGDVIAAARSVEMRIALGSLSRTSPATQDEVVESFLDWLLGMRLLKAHRQHLGVNFRLDTVEAKTAALRDVIVVSSECGILSGVFLLLDELEKQDGILSAGAIVRYLSALRAIIDALPNHLFMMLAITPDALRRYGLALPAFRNRLSKRIDLQGLTRDTEAIALSKFYFEHARKEAIAKNGPVGPEVVPLFTDSEVKKKFDEMFAEATKGGDVGLRQRSFLDRLHSEAELRLQTS